MPVSQIGSFGFRNFDLNFTRSFGHRGRLDAATEARAGNRLRINASRSNDVGASETRVSGPRVTGGPSLSRYGGSQPAGVSTQHLIERDVFVRQTPAEHTVQRSYREYFSQQQAPRTQPEPAPAEPAPAAVALPVETAPPADDLGPFPSAPPAVAAAPAAPVPIPAQASAEEEPLPVTTAPVDTAPVEAPPAELAPVETAPVEAAPEPPPAPPSTPVASRGSSYSASFEVVTQEGDKVSVSYNAARQFERSVKETPNGLEYSSSYQTRRDFSYSVQGNISDTELADIQKLSSSFDLSGLSSLAAFRYSTSFTQDLSRGLSVAG